MVLSSNWATDLPHAFSSSYWTNYIARVHWKESNCPSLVYTLQQKVLLANKVRPHDWLSVFHCRSHRNTASSPLAASCIVVSCLRTYFHGHFPAYFCHKPQAKRMFFSALSGWKNHTFLRKHGERCGPKGKDCPDKIGWPFIIIRGGATMDNNGGKWFRNHYCCQGLPAEGKWGRRKM